MHDFIEKPSRMILFVISIIALVTIIILLSKSSLISTGGESLVDANGKRIEAVTPTPIPAVAGQNGTAVAAEDEYIEVYVEDEPANNETTNNETDIWVETEIEDEAGTPAGQAEETVVIENETEPVQEEAAAPETQTEEPSAETETVEQEEVWDEVGE